MSKKSLLAAPLVALSLLVSAPVVHAIEAKPSESTVFGGDDFSAEVKAACMIEGTKEWRAREAKPTAAEDVIIGLERRLCRMFAARQIDALVDDYIADDGAILLDGAGLAEGREAQRGLFNYFLAEGYDLAWEPVKASVSKSGEMAWALGMVKVTSPDGSVEFAKYTSIWEKIEGKWRNVIEMRNGNGPLGATLFKR